MGQWLQYQTCDQDVAGLSSTQTMQKCLVVVVMQPYATITVATCYCCSWYHWRGNTRDSVLASIATDLEWTSDPRELTKPVEASHTDGSHVLVETWLRRRCHASHDSIIFKPQGWTRAARQIRAMMWCTGPESLLCPPFSACMVCRHRVADFLDTVFKWKNGRCCSFISCVCLSGTAGAVDEETFIRSFEDVSKVYVSNNFVTACLVFIWFWSLVCWFKIVYQ